MLERDALDTRLLAGDPVPAEAIKAALTGDSPPQGELRYLYVERLLQHALETRDAEASRLAASLMDADPALDERLWRQLNDRLYTQPDAVYAFVRARLADGPTPVWTQRLKLAALASLRVAINDGDGDTIRDWLTLIAREPAAYELNDVLYYGILAAQERARTDGELGRHLVVLAAKRAPALVHDLLDDPQLLAQLPDNFGHVLRDFDGDALQLLQNRGPELFLTALGRAARAGAGGLFTPAVVKQTSEWALSGVVFPSLPPDDQPEAILATWLNLGAASLSAEARETLLNLLVAARRDDQTARLLQANGDPALLASLPAALRGSRRPLSERLDLIGRLLNTSDVSPQQALNLYLACLEDHANPAEAQPALPPLVRLLQQHPTLTAPSATLWLLLAAAAESRDEGAAKTIIRRLLAELETQPEEDQLIAQLKRLYSAASWSEPLRQQVLNWWRGFVRGQPTAWLSRLDKALEGKRSLEAERGVVQTLLAARRLLGQQPLSEFAQLVSTAFTALGMLAEAFEPRRLASFDAETMKTELGARAGELSPQQRQVLSSNLKELAQLIAALGDSRTRAVLIRRGEDLDRALMSGEQPPHSAVDAMKWLAGYWGGLQTDAAEDQ